jgi:hypothetical protein
MTIPLNLAVEDTLSETVARKLLDVVSTEDRQFHIGTVFGRNGFGYLRRTINGWNNTAKGTPILVITDLDTRACPLELIADWFNSPIHANMLFRVAIKEIEAWLLADSEEFAGFLGVRRDRLPTGDPESIEDPKATIIELATTSRLAEIRRGVPPRSGTTAKQGPLYNPKLEQFVREHWQVERAADRSESLRRTVEKLRAFVPVWPTPTE